VQLESLEIVRRSCEAAAQGDLEGAMAELHPEVEVVDMDIPDAGSYRGPEGYLRWLAQWSDSFAAWSLNGLEYQESPDGRIVVLFDLRATGKGSGAEVQRGDAMVCTVRDEKIAKVVYYNDQARARAEAGMA
jgi:ketosteroid isomerase-like protein